MAERLIERALAHKMTDRHVRDITEDEMELGIAWAQGKIRSTQAAIALGRASCSPATYNHLATFLRAAVQAGKLVVPHA